MSISTERLGQVAGVCLVAAGAIFIGVQINHPPLTLEFVGTTEFIVRQTLKMIMTVLALAASPASTRGCAQRRSPRPGRVPAVRPGLPDDVQRRGHCGFVLPPSSRPHPRIVQDVLTASVGGTPTGDIGGMQILFSLSGVGYMVGGLMFGIALFRAGVVARWASRTARGCHRQHPCPGGAPGIVQPALRHPDRDRADRARMVVLAHVAGPGRRASRLGPSRRARGPMRADTTGGPGRSTGQVPAGTGVVPMALVTLGLIPLVAGLLRLVAAGRWPRAHARRSPLREHQRAARRAHRRRRRSSSSSAPSSSCRLCGAAGAVGTVSPDGWLSRPASRSGCPRSG